MPTKAIHRGMPVGAEALAGGGVHFRVWAPRRKKVEVVLENGPEEPEAIRLVPEEDGYFSGFTEKAGEGTLYRYRLDDTPDLFPDPASRFQPQGIRGPSMVIDPARFKWTDQAWKGVRLEGQVIYEMHIGTFTPEGTWKAAAEQFAELAALGITLVEMMPVAEFPGRYGWGYDGVDLFAPTRLYGTPDDLRRFVDRAHAAGLGVILDVVYNHLGPDGNFLKEFSADYFTSKYTTEWGEAINYDGKHSGPVREFFIENAGYWIREFHLDGLRLDATQSIFDDSPEHILAAIGRKARQSAHGRSTLLVAENEPQDVRLVRPVTQGGYGLDALWNDDFHHSAMVAMSGHNEAYYSDYLGTPQEFISAVKWGYLYQGQYYAWQKKRRGTPTFGLGGAAFVIFMQNHDQIANSFRGERCDKLTSPGTYRALTTLLLLAPGTPMLFQGQEFAASSPFLYFADHTEELARRVHEGRAQFLKQFRSLACPEAHAAFNDPAHPETFVRSKLDFLERERHAQTYTLHRDLLRLRREDPVFRAQRADRIQGAVLGPEAFLLRFFGDAGDDRLLLVNLGCDLRYAPAPEPLLAPPQGTNWEMLWSTEEINYGGCGTASLESVEGWLIPGLAAIVLRPNPLEKAHGKRNAHLYPDAV